MTRMSSGRIIVLLLLFLHATPLLSSEHMKWREHSSLPPLPGYDVQPGVAGAFAGVTNNHLLVMGGANFPDLLPWDGGVRSYWSEAYIYPINEDGEWKVIPNALTEPLAYGASISLPGGVLIIGGMNDNGMTDKVYLANLGPGNETVSLEPWPSLPVPLAYMTAALVGNQVFVAGGQSSVVVPAAERYFFMLDLRNRHNGWQTLPSWPGPPRALAVSAAQSDGFDNCFYLFSGRDFGPDRGLNILDDGYAYNPRLLQWEKLSDPSGPSFPVMAGTAFSSGVNHIVFLGGDGGELMVRQHELQKQLERLQRTSNNMQQPDSAAMIQAMIDQIRNNHPGFSRNILFYHTITNTLVQAGEIPFPTPVTTTVVKVNDMVVLPSGESMPGIRTPAVLVGEFIPHDKRFGTLNYFVLVFYFLILVGIGWFFSKRQKTTNDYFRGGGRIPWWAAGLSIFGTALSAITFMAIPAKAYATDWSYMLFNSGIILVAPVIILLFIPFYRKLNITTAYEYLEQRFNLATRVITSISFVIFQIGRMGVVLFLPSIALNVVTGIDIFLCIGLMGLLSLAYTMSGGIEAVVWTDAMQVVVLLGGAILAVILISFDVEGGFREIIASGMQAGKFHLAETRLDLKNPTLITVLIATVFANMTTYGTDQTIVQRYLTTATQKDAARSVATNAILTIPATLIFFFAGTALFVYFKNFPLMASPTIQDPDAIFPWYIFTTMPAGVSGLLIAGVFAAAMSTLSSSMNSSATAYMIDIHYRFGLSKNQKDLRLPRIATLVFGLAGVAFGMLMATWEIKSLWDEFQKILGLILGGLGGLFLLGLLTKRANGAGAIIGIVGSIVVQLIISQGQHLHLLLYAASGFISCFLIGYIASLLMPSFNKPTGHLTIYGLLKKQKDKSTS